LTAPAPIPGLPEIGFVFWQQQQRMTQMQYQSGQSGNLLARSPDARNKATLMAKGLSEDEAEAIARIVIEKAKAGDMLARDKATPTNRFIIFLEIHGVQ
jgi:hypothetical protein